MNIAINTNAQYNSEEGCCSYSQRGVHIEVVMRYAGLTDDLERRRLEHGNPRNFRVIQQFTSEAAARQWKRRMLAQGCEEDTSSKGWKYGYTFST